MSKRKSLEEIRSYFTSQGCRLLEEEYLNAHTKMKYVCVCGKESLINFNNFQSGKRCGCKRFNVRKTTTEQIKDEVESFGLSFISEEFINNQHVITCICKCGNKRKCALKNLRRGDCFKCRDKKMSLDFQYVRDFFTINGCRLLETEYKNARTSMKYLCNCGTEAKIVFDSFKRGNRCKNCKRIKLSGPNSSKWNPNRIQAAYNLRFRKACYTMVRSFFKATGFKKSQRTSEILGYNYNQLREHICSHPNWGKVSDGKWHIDHIFPIKAFLDAGIFDMKIICALDNLQPLSQDDNLSKNAKYDLNMFELWLKIKKENQ